MSTYKHPFTAVIVCTLALHYNLGSQIACLCIYRDYNYISTSLHNLSIHEAHSSAILGAKDRQR